MVSVELLAKFQTTVDDSGCAYGGKMSGGCLVGKPGKHEGLAAVSGYCYFEGPHTNGSSSRSKPPPAPLPSAPGTATIDFRHGPAREAVNEFLRQSPSTGLIRRTEASGWCGHSSLLAVLQSMPYAGLLPDPVTLFEALRVELSEGELIVMVAGLTHVPPQLSTTKHLDAIDIARSAARIFGDAILVVAESHFSAVVAEQRVELRFAMFHFDATADAVALVDLHDEDVSPHTLLTGKGPKIILYTSRVHQPKKRGLSGEADGPVVGRGMHIEPIVDPRRNSLVPDPYASDIFTSTGCWPLSVWTGLAQELMHAGP